MHIKIKLMRYADEPANMLKLVKKISSAIFEKASRYPKSNLKCGSILKVSWL